MNAHHEFLIEAKNELAMREEALSRYRKVRESLALEGYPPLYAMDDVITGTEVSITTMHDYIALISEEQEF